MLLVALAACAPQYPGEPVGSFHVVGALVENTCGPAAVPAFDPLVFDVEVRADRGQGFWRRPMLPVVSGTYGRDGAFRFSSATQTKILDPIEELGLPGCFVTQTEVVSGRVRPEDPDAGALGDGGDDARMADAGQTIDAGSDGGAHADADADAGPGTMALEGDNTVELVPIAGSVCGPATSAEGGPFLALPCSIHYTLTGTARAPF